MLSKPDCGSFSSVRQLSIQFLLLAFRRTFHLSHVRLADLLACRAVPGGLSGRSTGAPAAEAERRGRATWHAAGYREVLVAGGVWDVWGSYDLRVGRLGAWGWLVVGWRRKTLWL